MSHRVVAVGPAVDPVPLLTDEQVIFSVHPSLLPVVALVVGIVLAGGLLSVLFEAIGIADTLGVPSFRQLGIVLPLLVAGLVSLLVFLNWLNTIYTLTTLRVQWEFGILGEQVRNIATGDIEAVQVDQGLIGRIFNFGDIVIRSAAQPIPIRFVQITSPGRRAEQILAQAPI